MDDLKIKKSIESKIICMTRLIMQEAKCSEAVAFKKFKVSKVYEILADEKSRLYLEPIEFLYEAYCIEVKQSRQEMIKFINSGL